MNRTSILSAFGLALLAPTILVAQCVPNALTWPAPHGGTEYGTRVAMSGNIAVVGAPETTTSGQPQAGRVLVFERSSAAGPWTRTELVSPVPGPGYRFGLSLAAEGGVIVVGEPYANNNSGRAWVFEKVNGTWRANELQRTTQLMGRIEFGRAVGLSSDQILVGGNFTNPNTGGAPGGVFAFAKPTGGWSNGTLNETGEAYSPDMGNLGYFGGTISMSKSSIGIRALIGAVASPAQGQGGERAYVFDFIIGRWFHRATLVSPQAPRLDWYGLSLDIEGDIAIVGAPGLTNTVAGEGAAYLYTASAPTTWTLKRTLRPRVPSYNLAFATGVSLSNDPATAGRIAVGVPTATGYVRVFDPDPTLSAWSERVFIPNGDPIAGKAVALDGISLLVGAGGDRLPRPREAYHYWVGGALKPGSSVMYGSGCPGTMNKVPRHFLSGKPEVDEVAALELDDVIANTIGGLFIGLRQAAPVPVDFVGPGCFLHVHPLLAFGIQTTAAGTFTLSTRVPCNPALVGGKVASQIYVVDTGVPASRKLPVAVSNGLEITLGGR